VQLGHHVADAGALRLGETARGREDVVDGYAVHGDADPPEAGPRSLSGGG
jgi:hypothetical protein